MKPTVQGENRFENDASRYAAYLETPEGRLRADLAFENLQGFLPTSVGAKPLCALDLGCGTGKNAVRLARLGIHVTLLDSSAAMLEQAERTIVEAGGLEKTTLKHGDATCLADIFQPGSFDSILCHNLLEYVHDPSTVLREIVRVMRNSPAILSILVRNQAGEVLKAALQSGDLAAAEENLNAESAQESLYGGAVRLFTPDGQQTRMVKSGSSYLSQSELSLCFGLGRNETAGRVVIGWPSGRTDDYKSLKYGSWQITEGSRPANL